MTKQSSGRTLGWQAISAAPLYFVAAYWPTWSSPILKTIGIGDWNPIFVACAVTLTALFFIYVAMIATLVIRRVAINMNAVEAIVDVDTRQERVGLVADDIDDTYRIQASWVHLSIASAIAAVAWWNAGSLEAALAHAVAAAISLAFAPRGLRQPVRKTWQRIVTDTADYERSKNPWIENGNQTPRTRRKEIVSE